MKGVLHITVSAIALVVPAAWGQVALAQAATAGTAGGPLTYAVPGGGDDAATAPDGSSAGAAGTQDAGVPYAPPGGAGTGGKARKRTRIVPYLEVDQSVFDQIQPSSPAVTYTTLAAGVDMTFNDRRTSGTASVRYAHDFGESGNFGSDNSITGIARTTTQIVPHTLQFDFGGMATRTSIAPNGGTLVNPVDNIGRVYQIWSLYGGPSLTTHAGIFQIKGSYDLGYSEIDQLHTYGLSAGSAPVDLFDHSFTQQGAASVGVRPGDLLPFGVTVLGGYMREDMSTLDQRLIDEHLGIQLAQPVSRTLELLGDVGWEKVEVSQRNAVLDANGNAEVAPNGQYVIDESSPRQMAYRTDGLTWDVGVEWRPSKRTMAAAFVGRRYDSWTYYGSLNYAPNSRETLNVSVFDGIYGFGSGMLGSLEQMPTDFTATRDPFSGNVGGCFQGSTGGSCLSGALGGANALVYRAHGVGVNYGVTVGRLGFNLGGGYVSQRYIAAQGTVLASENGVMNQVWYVNAGLSGPIDRETRFYVGGFASLYHTGELDYGDTRSWAVNGSLIHHLTDRLVGTASVEVAGASAQLSPEELELMGQLGLRYNFR
jgi:hypothetical protein